MGILIGLIAIPFLVIAALPELFFLAVLYEIQKTRPVPVPVPVLATAAPELIVRVAA